MTTFHPPGAPIPEGIRTERVWLRPLRATDVELDYDAVMSSAPMLRRWSQTEWPADDFTLAGNLADLERHEREHEERVAFTYTVLDPTAARCLGCVYLAPLRPEERAACDGAHPVRAAFWVRSSGIVHDLDRHLFDTLRPWLASAWAFDDVVFYVSVLDPRQITLMEQAGLIERLAAVLPDGRRSRLYGAPRAAR